MARHRHHTFEAPAQTPELEEPVTHEHGIPAEADTMLGPDGRRYSLEAATNTEHNDAVLAFEGMLLATRESDRFGSPGDHGEAPERAALPTESQAEYPSKPE